MMTETDKLRALLDGRGVQYEADDGRAVRTTTWANANGKESSFAEYDTGETRFITDCLKFTADQAVDATLGRGECVNAMPGSDVDRRMMFRCSECGAVDVNHFYPADWYESEHSDDEWVEYDGERLSYCPSCGWRVKEGR